MSTIHYILTAVIILFSINIKNNRLNYCDLMNKNSVSVFKAKINGQDWEAKTSYYSLNNNKINITALGSNSEMLFISFEGNKTGTYKLDSLSYFYYNDSTYVVQSGCVIIDIFTTGICNGYLSFEALNINSPTDKITVSDGIFENVKKDNELNQDNLSFKCSKEMKIDVNQGKISTIETPVEINATTDEIYFNYTAKSNKSFYIYVSKEEKTSTMSIFYSYDENIDKVTIDILNENQTTIWYKNGNTTTFFK